MFLSVLSGSYVRGLQADYVHHRLGPNIVRVLPSTCVTFLVYENMKWYVPRMWHDARDDPIEAVE